MNRPTRSLVPALALIACAQTARVDAGETYAAVEGARPYTLTVAMSGYSPVSYLDERKAEPGSPAFAAEHDGLTYFFTSEAQRRKFRRAAERCAKRASRVHRKADGRPSGEIVRVALQRDLQDLGVVERRPLAEDLLDLVRSVHDPWPM